MSSVALHTRPPKSALGFHHAMLSRQESILLLIQFPLLVQELFCSGNSMITAGSITTSEEAQNQTAGGTQHHNKQASPSEQ
jgi:hypothetical protein